MPARLMALDGFITGQTFSVPDDEPLRIGRLPDAEIPIMEQSMSRNHCEIFQKGNKYILLDQGSVNGTFVNGKRTETCVLKSGDEVRTGSIRFVFTMDEKAAKEIPTKLILVPESKNKGSKEERPETGKGGDKDSALIQLLAPLVKHQKIPDASPEAKTVADTRDTPQPVRPRTVVKASSPALERLQPKQESEAAQKGSHPVVSIGTPTIGEPGERPALPARRSFVSRCPNCTRPIYQDEIDSHQCKTLETKLHCPGCTECIELVGKDFGNYRVFGLLSISSVGAIYRAQHVETGHPVALKIMTREAAKGEDAVLRYIRQAKIGKEIDHPNIAAIYDLGAHEGKPFIVIQFIAGQSLMSLIQQKGKLSGKEAAGYIWPIADGLSHAHERDIIIRDFRPHLIKISQKGVPILTDLGLAKNISDPGSQLTSQHQRVGKPGYLAPEQIRTEKKLDHRVDIYALGATLYHAVTGRPPFTGETAREIMQKTLNEPAPNPKQFNPDLSDDFVLAISTAMAKRPEERFVTAKQLGAVLKHFA
ncbi:MAG: protein kinase [Planctomycetota bacterium]|nr:protein kinase [Planctomycetota bacterium]